PREPVKVVTWSSAACISPKTSAKPAISKFPTAWPASAPVPPKRCCNVVAHSWPLSSSGLRADSAIRRSPGGMISSSRRKRPEEPPSSATVTMAEILVGSHCREASKFWNRPCPPPRHAILTEEVLNTLLRGLKSSACLKPSGQAGQKKDVKELSAR